MASTARRVLLSPMTQPRRARCVMFGSIILINLLSLRQLNPCSVVLRCENRSRAWKRWSRRGVKVERISWCTAADETHQIQT
jgi:hypothetical protein